MRILVTGGAGFIGRNLLPNLLDAGHQVTLLLRETYGLGAPLPAVVAQRRAAYQVVYADLRTYSLTARAVAEAAPEVVIHLAAAGVTDPFLPLDTALRHNLNGTLNLLRACFERQAIQRLVIGRTPGEASAANTYAASKAAAWQFCQMYTRTQGWPIVGATVFQVYGPDQPPHTLIPSALRAARAGEDFPMTSGVQQRDWIHVEDVAQGLLAMLSAELPPGASVDIGRGQLTSLLEVVQTIYSLAGRGGRPLPGALPNRPGEVPAQQADAARTAALLGWRAAIDLTDGLRRLLAPRSST